VWDVWQEVIPIGEVENAESYIRYCDAYLSLPDCERKKDVRTAHAMGKTILFAQCEEDTLIMNPENIGKAPEDARFIVWREKERLIKMIKGER